MLISPKESDSVFIAMQLKLFAILVLLIPAIRSGGAILDLATGLSNDTMPCCKVVEVKTCCGEVIVEKVCETTGTEVCHCMDKPKDPPEPLPTPIMPTSISDLMFSIPEIGELIVWDISAEPAKLDFAADEFGQLTPSHNETQAILGIWRI